MHQTAHRVVLVSGIVGTAVPPLSVVSLSVVSITHGRPQSENIKWKIPEINNS